MALIVLYIWILGSQLMKAFGTDLGGVTLMEAQCVIISGLWGLQSHASILCCSLLRDYDVNSQLLFPLHVYLPAAILPTTMAMISPSETVSLDKPSSISSLDHDISLQKWKSN